MSKTIKERAKALSKLTKNLKKLLNACKNEKLCLSLSKTIENYTNTLNTLNIMKTKNFIILAIAIIMLTAFAFVSGFNFCKSNMMLISAKNGKAVISFDFGKTSESFNCY